jgi:hypothetical protein
MAASVLSFWGWDAFPEATGLVFRGVEGYGLWDMLCIVPGDAF